MHYKVLDFFQAWYNFIKPHESLKLKIDSEKGKMVPKSSSNCRKINQSHMKFKGIINVQSSYSIHETRPNMEHQ